jgi:predicted phage terminase large subunit-like protein
MQATFEQATENALATYRTAFGSPPVLWRSIARPDQLAPPGDWRVWLILAGRGWGKTRTGAEWVIEQVRDKGRKRIALVGATAADTRDVMIEGESGILSCAPDDFRPTFEPSKRRLTFPNGAICTSYSADEPNRLRGPQHDGAWCDEPAAWKYAETWDMLMFGLRLGDNPQALATTTPRPIRLIRELIEDSTTAITRGSTYDNRANLAPQFLDQIIKKYEGTRLGRQELAGELLDDVPGALWSRAMIDGLRRDAAPELQRVVVAIDPAVTSGEDSDETGIVVAGRGVDGRGYVLADRTCRMTAKGWANRAVQAYEEFEADMIVAEVNNGGDLVREVIQAVNKHVPYKAVHASRGKRVRAEPISALYEKGEVFHVGKGFPDLEDQMCQFTPDGYDGSPDRVDALVWALTEIMTGGWSDYA